jgi:hypothetical protein
MKRVSFCIVLFLTIGFITMLAISWMLAISTSPRSIPRFNITSGVEMTAYYDERYDTIWAFNSSRTVAAIGMVCGNHGPAPEQGWALASIAREHDVERSEIPAWSVMHTGDEAGVFAGVYIEHAFGWPMLAMAQRFKTDRSSGRLLHADGLHLPEGLHRLGPGEYVPLRLIWLGAAVNSALYGWMFFAVWAFPGIVRRLQRRRRGRCSACGYDLRATRSGRCPECGAS